MKIHIADSSYLCQRIRIEIRYEERQRHNRSLQKNILTYYADSNFIEGVSEQDTKITWKGWAQWLPKGDTNNFRITRSVFNSFIVVQRDINLRSLGSLTANLRCYDPFETAKDEGIFFGIRELTSKNPARRTFMLNLTWKYNEARSRSAMPLGSSKKYRGSGAGEKQKARM